MKKSMILPKKSTSPMYNRETPNGLYASSVFNRSPKTIFTGVAPPNFLMAVQKKKSPKGSLQTNFSEFESNY